jgi:2-phosphosulfolactate phosphatase
MKINILHMIDGAKKARGITVIIDVFRAFSFECYAMANGAKKIIPVGDKEIAYKLKAENPDYILAGERHGKILEGFDVGNSPAQIENMNLIGKTIIHTTSAGTQGLANATESDEIITGSLVNARAIATYIKSKNPKEISLVCMGWEATSQTEEDNLCAKYIKSILENSPIHIEKEIEKLKVTSGAKFFDVKQHDVFPQRDFDLCTDVDKFDFVLKLIKTDDIAFIQKASMPLT